MTFAVARHVLVWLKRPVRPGEAAGYSACPNCQEIRGNEGGGDVTAGEQNINEAKDKAHRISGTCRFPGEANSTVQRVRCPGNTSQQNLAVKSVTLPAPPVLRQGDDFRQSPVSRLINVKHRALPSRSSILTLRLQSDALEKVSSFMGRFMKAMVWGIYMYVF